MQALWLAGLGNKAARAKKLWRSWLFQDEIAEQNKCKNMQNILLERCYVLFDKYPAKKQIILKPCQEIGRSFEESLQGGFFISLEIF